MFSGNEPLAPAAYDATRMKYVLPGMQVIVKLEPPMPQVSESSSQPSCAPPQAS